MKNKTKRIDLLASDQDEKLLQKAAAKLGTKKVSETIFQSVAEVANKPVEYYCDRVAIKQTIANVEYGRVHLTSFIKEFKEVTGEYLTIEELQTCFAGIGKLGSQLILQEAIRELVTKKLYDRMVAAHPDMVVLADNVPSKDMTMLFEVAGKLDNIPEIKMFFIGILWNCYSISSEGAVSVIPDQVEKLNNSYRFYASSVGELQKLQKVKKLCEVLNEIAEDPEVLADRIFTLVYYDREAAKFSPSGAYVKFNLTPQVYFSK